ncbi:MAG: T9SS type A sorting domain-containing protein, partial [candidate division Zixibacteria bacterium]|nr:T9SS type A sorting domain-containing protein [candidate division Zixibacteria bacterium]
NIYPIRFLPDEKKIEVSSELNINIYTGNGGGDFQSEPGNRPVAEELLALMVDNYDRGSINSYAYPEEFLKGGPTLYSPTGSIHEYEYIVVTDASLAESFETLVEWKRRKGIWAGIVTLQEIESGYSGIDIQEKIRNFLKDAYEVNLKWVLLGGDETIIPIRYTYHNNTSTQPDYRHRQICDLYYSDLTGVWEVDNDGVWGERTHDNPDIYPEVYVGRLAVNSPEEVEAFTEKLLIYEQNPGNGNYSYLTSALFITADEMVNLGQHVTLGNAMPSNFMVDTSTCAERPSGNDPNPTGPSGDDVIARMNYGFGFVSNLNHGSPHRYAAYSGGYNGGPKSYVQSDLNYGGDHEPYLSLNEDYKYSIHYSISCYTSAYDMDDPLPWPGGFDGDNCMGEVYVNMPDKGGVAYLGNGRWGWVGTSYKLQKTFIEMLYGEGVLTSNLLNHIGVAEAMCKTEHPNYMDIDYGHFLLGDPEMPVWKDIPKIMTVYYETNIPIRRCSYRVVAEAYNNKLDDAKVSLYKSGEVFATGYTGGDGRAFIDIEPFSEGVLYLTVTKEGYIPYTAEITVEPNTGLSEDEDILPIEFNLYGNYPNPFNRSTVIEYDLPASSNVELAVYDVSGRLVEKQDYGMQEPGSNKVISYVASGDDGQDLASGIYFYKLQTVSGCKVGKMTLVK